MTSTSRHRSLSRIVILAAVATLSAVSSATAWGQGFRVGPTGVGWNSGGSLNLGRVVYSESSIYTRQFRQLQQEAARRPESLEVQFLLAYHYLMLGHLQHGENQLLKVLEIQPDDPVTQQLLQAVRVAQIDAEKPNRR